MVNTRRRDTRTELAIRTLLHRMGLRYRVDYAPMSWRPRADVVFTKAKLAVFIDGCFWHGCPDHYIPPVRHSAFWIAKLTENRRRDEVSDAALNEAGWAVLRVWEHEAPQAAATRIAQAIAGHLSAQQPHRR